jgi:PIN domain nuclease of toxin-antitoxin system
MGSVQGHEPQAEAEARPRATIATMIILDTHAWLWLCLEPRRLSTLATNAIRHAIDDGGLAIASISLLEVAKLVARGRIVPQGTADAWLDALIDRSSVTIKEITPAVATIAAHFPDDFPGDPADRLIAATARAGGAALVTRDASMRASSAVETIW